jgi:hypothetical protein
VIKGALFGIGTLRIVAGVVIVVGAGLTEIGFTLSPIQRNAWVPVRL